MKSLVLTAFLFCIYIFNPALASESITVGKSLPHQLQSVDQNGKNWSFATLKGDEGLVVAFVRSVDWCPYCQMQVVDINSRLSEFRKTGYNVAVISYDSIEKTKFFADKHNIKFPLLSDSESDIIKAFGILNTDQKPGSRYYGIPDPTIYVINPEGTVTAIFAEEGYKKRPELDDILLPLKKPAP